VRTRISLSKSRHSSLATEKAFRLTQFLVVLWPVSKTLPRISAAPLQTSIFRAVAQIAINESVRVGLSDLRAAFLTGRLKLKVNETKSAVAQPHTRKFLGFTFLDRGQVKRRIAPKALARFKARIRELTQRTRGVSADQLIGSLKRYLTGWRGYFGFCETPRVLQRLDQWIRRRLRCFLWKQWKRGRTRFKKLVARGVSRDLAAQTAGSPHSAWRLSCSPALSIALPSRYFRSLGLPSVGSS
jgi:RNA-directed DNA polymerase